MKYNYFTDYYFNSFKFDGSAEYGPRTIVCPSLLQTFQEKKQSYLYVCKMSQMDNLVVTDSFETNMPSCDTNTTLSYIYI